MPHGRMPSEEAHEGAAFPDTRAMAGAGPSDAAFTVTPHVFPQEASVRRWCSQCGDTSLSEARKALF